MTRYVRQSAWIELKKRLLVERGSICERCRIRDVADLHHSLISKMKGKPELNVEYNAELVCKECHANIGGYNERLEFWHKQCARYGTDVMREWYDNLSLLAKELFE